MTILAPTITHEINAPKNRMVVLSENGVDECLEWKSTAKDPTTPIINHGPASRNTLRRRA